MPKSKDIPQSEELKQRIQNRLDAIVIEIAKELKICFGKRQPQINDRTPYYHLMTDMGLVQYTYPPIDSDFVSGNTYPPTPNARILYDTLLKEGFYDKPEFFWV